MIEHRRVVEILFEMKWLPYRFRIWFDASKVKNLDEPQLKKTLCELTTRGMFLQDLAYEVAALPAVNAVQIGIDGSQTSFVVYNDWP